ncbi:MAG TPA: hypothetical protein VML54_15540, partial [Candidatus Limnocylindrales bacterium]|nr:hypothetical protein [Candidatus Limnocylindrales bacterium]
MLTSILTVTAGARERAVACALLAVVALGGPHQGTAQPRFSVLDIPPNAALISLSEPDGNGDVIVTGQPGAVSPGNAVILVNLDTGFLGAATSRPDGSFTGQVFGPYGTFILVKADPTGAALSKILVQGPMVAATPNLPTLPGTILKVPEPLATSGVPVGAAGSIESPGSSLPLWIFRGQIDGPAFAPGARFRITGTIDVVSPALAGAGAMSGGVIVRFRALTRPDGHGVLAEASFASTFLTPTELPIERQARRFSEGLDAFGQFTLTPLSPDRASGAIDFAVTLPADLPHGYYRPFLVPFFDGVPAELPPSRVQIAVGGADRGFTGIARLPIIKVGAPAPPRLYWTLLADALSNGSRGARATEDRPRFGVAPRILTSSETLVIPRQDPASGQPIRYPLEPYVLTVSLGNELPPHPPLIPFRFPSGSLTARVRKPDGSTLVIGPAPFVQSRVISPGNSEGITIDSGGGHITDVYRLSTMDPRFEMTFDQDGRHVVTLEGSIEDVWGNVWTGGGTYEVDVARILSLDTAVLPGMAFEVGDAVSPGLTISPPVPADVEVRLRLAPDSDPARMIERTVRGRANRFGYFQPLGGHARLAQPGEYRIDVVASFRDDEGRRWAGSRTWGGVVAARSPSIIAHGRRGVDNVVETIGPQWFFRLQSFPLLLAGGGHVSVPFHSGDVMWLEDGDSANPHLTIQDPGGAFTSLLRRRGFDPSGQFFRYFLTSPGEFDERAVVGEVSLFSGGLNGWDPHLAPERVDLWAYSYRSVQRPLVRVREEIGEDPTLGGTYWRFDEQYAGQIGVGLNGDLPNDIKFQYGGAVLRGTALARPEYAIYGSLFVLVPDTTPRGGASRVFPPFQGNGGGPSGGPIMTLKGRAIDLFAHLTGVRPGSVLEVGDTFSLVAAIGPPLPAVVSYTVTRPSGAPVTFSGRGSRVGYYYRPGDDFTVDQPGLYQVDLQVHFDGVTSAGQVTPPFPTGDVLGTASGRFHVYVVPRGSAPFEVTLPRNAFVAAPATLDVPARAPAGMTPTRVHRTTMMPGFVLDSGDLAPASRLTYRYDPVALARDFPNLDV